MSHPNPQPGCGDTSPHTESGGTSRGKPWIVVTAAALAFLMAAAQLQSLLDIYALGYDYETLSADGQEEFGTTPTGLLVIMAIVVLTVAGMLIWVGVRALQGKSRLMLLVTAALVLPYCR